MVTASVRAPDSSATGNIAPLKASFLRHLHAENRSQRSCTTFAKAIDHVAAYLAAPGMLYLPAVTREYLEQFLGLALAAGACAPPPDEPKKAYFASRAKSTDWLLYELANAVEPDTRPSIRPAPCAHRW
jgi:hypothetical protein